MSRNKPLPDSSKRLPNSNMIDCIQSKPFTEAVESGGRDDVVVAAEAREVYKKRNGTFYFPPPPPLRHFLRFSEALLSMR